MENFISYALPTTGGPVPGLDDDISVTVAIDADTAVSDEGGVDTSTNTGT